MLLEPVVKHIGDRQQLFLGRATAQPCRVHRAKLRPSVDIDGRSHALNLAEQPYQVVSHVVNVGRSRERGLA
jgi:hypothetical protein